MTSSAEHERDAAAIVPRIAVVTLSDTRGVADDRSGQAIRQLAEAADMQVVEHALIRDEPAELRRVLDAWTARDDVDAIVTNGGTGIARRDQTIDVVRAWIEVELPGFGELFRMLSYAQVGPAAMMSRAIAGTRGRRAIFALPGSTPAVELAMTALIVPQLRHVLRELRK